MGALFVYVAACSDGELFPIQRIGHCFLRISHATPCDEPYHAAFGDLDLVVVVTQVALKGISAVSVRVSCTE